MDNYFPFDPEVLCLWEYEFCSKLASSDNKKSLVLDEVRDSNVDLENHKLWLMGSQTEGEILAERTNIGTIMEYIKFLEAFPLDEMQGG